MKKILLSLVAILSINIALLAQENSPKKQFFFDFGLGGSLHSFQDAKYSDVRYNGIGATGNIDFTWRRKSIISTGIEGYYSKEKPKTFDSGVYSTEYNISLYLKYLHPIIKNDIYNIYMGGKVDLYSMSIRNTFPLENNSFYLTSSIGFKAVTMYERRLNDLWILNADLGLQLFSFMNEYMSFAYAADQITLEKGEYNYDEAEAPLRMTPFWDYFNIETNIKVQYGERWIFGYSWKMQQSYATKDYKMTKGYSSLIVTYRIVNKTR
jgi:hypothetical protein